MSETVELARRLGLLRTRKIAGGSKEDVRSSSKTETQKTFRFLTVIDFESTCWEDKTAAASAEIIEFPAILLDTKTGDILGEFHQYVLPTENPKLSEFCTNLTGIEQKTVDEKGVPIRTCLYLFKDWIDKLRVKHEFVINDIKEGFHSMTFVTWQVPFL